MNNDPLCGLTTLPQEILELLLCEMDWKDVLSIRATCTVLCFASQSRAVWRVQYQRVSDSYDTPLNVMDGTATYAELERDTLHWARLQHNWSRYTSFTEVGGFWPPQSTLVSKFMTSIRYTASAAS
ncbi:hypothetical protein AB1N83_013319 [Pleurotus pulmonarius]